MLLLGACSEGADIGIMNPQSFSESYKLPTRSVLVFFSKQTHKNMFRTKTLMIHYICRSIFPTNLGSLEVVVLFCLVMPRLTSSTPTISGVSWTLPKKPPGIFWMKRGTYWGKVLDDGWMMVRLMLDASDKKSSGLSSESSLGSNI